MSVSASHGFAQNHKGKVKTSVEFGAKLDLSIDEKRDARIEMILFDAYNESCHLQEEVIGYYERTGRYPERILVDQIYQLRRHRNSFFYVGKAFDIFIGITHLLRLHI